MRCDRARKSMDRYLIEGLSREERAAFEAHLDVCQDCQRRIDSLRRLVAVLQGEPVPPLPDHFADRVMARARREGQSFRPTSGVRRAVRLWWEEANVASIANAAAAVAAGLLLGLVLGEQSWQRVVERPTIHRDSEALESLDFLSGNSGMSFTETYLSLTNNAQGS